MSELEGPLDEHVETTSRAERTLLRNTILNILGSAVPLLAVVVFVPYLIDRLGDERFGLLSLVLALLAYVNALNLGLGRAITFRSAQSRAGVESLDIASMAWAATYAQLAIGSVGAIVLAFTARPLASVMDFSSGNLSEAVSTLRLLGLLIPVVMVMSTYRGLLEGAQRFGAVNAVVGPLGFMDFSLPAIALALGHGVTAVVVMLLVTRSTALIVLVRLCTRSYPGLLRRPTQVRRNLRSLLTYGGWVAVSDLAYPIFNYLDRFLLAAFAGIGAVTPYVVPYEIVTRLWFVPTSLGSAVFPLASSIQGDEDPEALEALYARGTRLMLLGVLPVATLVGLFSHELLAVWISADFADGSAGLLRILTLSFVINALAVMGSALLQGQGLPRLRAQLHLIELPGYLLAAWLLIPSHGATGAAWAEVIRMCLTTVLVYIVVRRSLGLGRRVLFQHRVHLVSIVPVTFLAVGLVGADVFRLLPRIVIALVGSAAVVATWLRFERAPHLTDENARGEA